MAVADEIVDRVEQKFCLLGRGSVPTPSLERFWKIVKLATHFRDNVAPEDGRNDLPVPIHPLEPGRCQGQPQLSVPPEHLPFSIFNAPGPNYRANFVYS